MIGRIRPLGRSSLSWSSLSSIGVAALTACSAPPTVPAAGEPIPIVDGTRELGEDAVVYVAGVIGSCTGTLITDRVVLTAKHCVQSRGAERPAPPSFFSVGIGNRATGLSRSLRILAIETTPGGFFGSAITDGSDIALMILREPVTDVTPIAVRRAAPTGLAGSEVTAIGFGQTPAGESGIKYRTVTTIDSISSVVLFGAMAICQGDSGGPIILEADGTRPREIVGVASYGQSMVGGVSCPAIVDAWNRVDIHLALVDRAILRSGGCVDRGDETCNALDDDCNGTIDDGCAALGDPCETDADCAYGPLPEGLGDGAPPSVICGEVGGARRCALPCDALEPGAGCSEIDVPFRTEDVALDGFYCAQVAGCDGLCVAGAAGTGENGDPCAADTECATLFCADAGVCATPCRGNGGVCPVDEACSADVDACGFCAAAVSRPSGRGLGERCESSEQCASGACGSIDGASVCTQPCATDSTCGSGFRCAEGFCAGGPRATLFGTCRTGDDCGGAACLESDGRRICASRCSDAASCAGTCTAVTVEGDEEMRCLPVDPVLGAPCIDVCAEGVCLEGTCTALCGGADACPVGYDCVRDRARTLCRARASGGGCAIGHGAGTSAPSAAAWGALVALALWSRARRRR